MRVNFKMKSGIFQKGNHPFTSGFTEITEDDRTAEKISRVVRCVPPEKLCEHQTHNQKLEKRIEYTPEHAEYGSCIAFFKVSFDKLLETDVGNLPSCVVPISRALR